MYVYTTHHSAILLQYYATYLYVTPRHTSTFTPYITTYLSTYNPSSTLLYYTLIHCTTLQVWSPVYTSITVKKV